MRDMHSCAATQETARESRANPTDMKVSSPPPAPSHRRNPSKRWPGTSGKSPTPGVERMAVEVEPRPADGNAAEVSGAAAAPLFVACGAAAQVAAAPMTRSITADLTSEMQGVTV